MALATGTPAPLFTLNTKTPEGLEELSLEKLIGAKKVVLLFFPFAFTSVCKEELCSVTQGLDAYRSLDAEVIGISVDSPFAQEAFAQKENIGITLLSDFNTEVSKAYDVLYEDFIGFKGVSKRSAFVIGKSGNIDWSWSSDNPKDLPDFNAITEALKN